MRRFLIVWPFVFAFVGAACGGGVHADSRVMATSGGAMYESNEQADYEWGGETALASEPPSGGLFDDMVVSGSIETRSQSFDGSRSESKEVIETAQVDPADVPEDASNDGSTEPETPTTPKRGKRIIIYSAQMGIYVLEVENAVKSAAQKNEELGGWVQASTSNSVMLRVPAENFMVLIEALREYGNVESENITGQDVSEEYFDLEIRLRNAMDLRARYVALLERAKTVKEALAIEAELGRLTGEIESMKGRLRFLSEHAAYSTIHATFYQQPGQPTAKQYVALPFRWLRDYTIGNLYEAGYY